MNKVSTQRIARGKATPSLPRAPSTFVAGTLVPPDTSSYTTFSPTSSQASYATFDALSTSIGGSQLFSYSLLVRFQSFGAGMRLDYVGEQQLLSLMDGTELVGGLYVNYGAHGNWLTAHYRGSGMFVMFVELERWYDITFTWDGTHASVYLDGGLISTLESDVDEAKSPVFTLGMDATNPPARPPVGETAGPFVGDVKRFYVWNICLGAGDVAQQMWSPPHAPVKPSNLLLGYDFTTSPPNKVGNGPDLKPVSLLRATESPALFSWGNDVATPGQGTTANPGGGAPFSILAWVYPGKDGYGPDDGYIVSNGDATDPHHLGVKLMGGKVVVEFGSQTVNSNTVLDRHQWHYVGVTYDGATCRIYVNKKLDASGPISGAGTPSAGALRLMGILNNGRPDSMLLGYIQFLSIWDKALTASQVSEQADEDPTLDPSCTANFMMSDLPFEDSIAVERFALWGVAQLRLGQGMMVDSVNQTWSPASPDVAMPRRVGRNRVSAKRAPALRLARCPGPIRPATMEPFSTRHRALMVEELKSALSAIPSGAGTHALLEQYRAEVDRVFDLAATSPHLLEGPRVSYRKVEEGFALFYHPDAWTEVDLQVRADGTQECAMWWTTFILTAILGLLTTFGVPTPIDDLTTLATRIITAPAVVETLQTVVGLTFTAGTLLSLLKLLYDFGYLSQALWLAVSKLSWWAASKFIVYAAGLFAPVPSPQQALFVANAVVTVGKMVQQLLQYPTACGAESAAVPSNA